jgi:hypothetical protein
MSTFKVAMFCIVLQILIELNKNKTVKISSSFTSVLVAIAYTLSSPVNVYSLLLIGVSRRRTLLDFDDYLSLYMFLAFGLLNSWKLINYQKDTKIIGRLFLSVFTLLILGEFVSVITKL